MTRFADPSRCPDCGAPVPPAPERCARCALPLTGPVAQDLFLSLQRADDLLGLLRRTARVPVGAAAGRAPGEGTPDRPHFTGGPSDPRYTAFPESFPAEFGLGSRDLGTERRTGLSQASVPKILLSLGALCLLVAAVVFLALAWSVLGVGGRTAVLVALTATAAGCCALVARRGLRAGAESLAAVAAGLLALDLAGADNAGWLGDLGAGGLTVVVGGVLAAAGVAAGRLAVRSTALTRLTVAEVVAALGVLLVTVGALVIADAHHEAVLVAGVAGTCAVAVLCRRRLEVTAAVSLAGAVGWWVALLATGLVRAGRHASYGELWGDLQVWPLVAASALVAAPVLVPSRVHRDLRVACALVGALVLALAAGFALPGLERDLGTGLALAAVLGAALATYLVGGAWRIVPTGVLGLSWLMPAAALLELTGRALGRLLPDEAWSQPVGVALAEPAAGGVSPLFLAPIVLAVVASVVAAGRLAGETLPVLRRSVCVVTSVLVLSVAGTLASYAVPLALVLALLLLAAAVLASWSLSDSPAPPPASMPGTVLGPLLGLLGALGILLGALLVAMVSTWLTAAVLLVLVAGAAALVLGPERSVADRTVRLLGEVCLPPAAGALLWTACELAAIPGAERGVAVLLLLGALAIARPRPVTETLCAAVAALAAAVGIAGAADPAWWLAVDLTVAGTLVALSALVHPARRSLAPVGGLLLAAASWVRLADLGVGTPEAYTLPSAGVLLVTGVVHLLRHPGAGTRRALAPGLLLALVPSLLWSLGDPVSWRALTLGAACLTLVLGGLALRWSAPVSLAAGVGTLLVLRELAPYAGALPQWVLIGLAGTLLTFVGVTWESRVRQVRASGAFLGRLR